MLETARKYPNFVVPLPRPSTNPDTGAEEIAHEFHFLQWGFHDVPPVPSADLFAKPLPDGRNPQTATVLSTPLQEYKLRQAFSTPYLIFTMYTDLAHSHGVVLLRGEITAAGATSAAAGASEGAERFMLSQADAHQLAVNIQKFWLWNEGGKEGEGQRLLRTFHETPESFQWEQLIAFT
jgi:ATP synthase F1 complex assembly factor 1